MNRKVQLQEFIHPHMDILLVALNASEKSNSNGQVFSGSMSFWNLLYDAGLIIQRIGNDPREGEELDFRNSQINFRNHIYGFTDLNREVVETKSIQVVTNDDQVNRIIQILDKHKVGRLCLIHSRVAKQFEKSGLVRRKSGELQRGYGKIGNYHKMPIYEMPFHCASIPDKHEFYKSLAN